MLRYTPFFLIFTAAGFAQPQAAQDPLQALLAEVHQLRMDLQATTITSQRVQILLYRVQLQQSATQRASSHAEDTHVRLLSVQQGKARSAQEIQQLQGMIEQTTDQTTLKQLQLQLTAFKQGQETFQNDEQQWQARDIEAQSQLRAEQAKLGDLQDTLDKLDKALANLTKQ